MSQETGSLLESDRLEEVLDEPLPPHPVVVVQYPGRKKTRTWAVALVLACFAVLGSLFVLHRREVNRLHEHALSLERRLQASQVDTSWPPKPVGRAGESAADPAPATAPRAIAELRPRGEPPTEKPSTATAIAAWQDAAGPADRPDPASPASGKSGPEMDRARRSAKVEAGPDAVRVAEPTSKPATTTEPIAAATAPQRGIVIEPATALPGPEDGRAVAAADAGDGAGSPLGGPDGVETAGAGANTTAPAALAVAPAPAGLDERPLPTREETEREILEEARRKKAEAESRLVQQKREVVDIREDERQRFRDELRLILELHGSRAGKQIADLSDRSGRDNDPRRRALALRVIGTSGTSQRTKVQQLRAVGVPEPVILDYLANEFNNNLGSRNGPRSRNEVWIMAARLLMKYEWKPPTDPPAAVPPRPEGAAGQPAVRPASQPAATGPRVAR